MAMNYKVIDEHTGEEYTLYAYAKNMSNGHVDEEMCLFFKTDDDCYPKNTYTMNKTEFFEKYKPRTQVKSDDHLLGVKDVQKKM